MNDSSRESQSRNAAASVAAMPVRPRSSFARRTSHFLLFTSHFSLFTFCFPLLLFLPACQSYEIRGTVIEGGPAAVVVVDADDPRLQGSGLANVVIDAILDPDTASRRLNQTITDPTGQFAMPVDSLGAGMLEYEAAMVFRRRGYNTVEAVVDLPGRRKRLLVIMPPGRDDRPPRESILEETLRQGKQLDK